MKRSPDALIATLCALAPSMAIAQAREFQVQPNGGSRAQFVSEAPLEAITGVTSHLSGSARIDPVNLSTSSGRIEVPVANIRTGIDLRDEHLRNDTWLNASAHPNIVFELTRIEGARSLRPNQNTRLQIRGRVTIKGVTRDVVWNARARFVPLSDQSREAGLRADAVFIQAKTNIRLSDYNITIPAPVRLKLANEIEVQVALRFVATS